MAGAASLTGDRQIRTPMSWSGDAVRAGFTTGTPFRALSANLATHNVADEAGQPGSLLAWYRALIALRRSVPALAAGSAEAPLVLSSTTLTFRRTLGDGHALVLLNYATAASPVSLPSLPAGATLKARFPAGAADAVVDADGSLSLTAPPLAVLVFTWSG
jgi:glycosidase